jgi:hypothetical protein
MKKLQSISKIMEVTHWYLVQSKHLSDALFEDGKQLVSDKEIEAIATKLAEKVPTEPRNMEDPSLRMIFIFNPTTKKVTAEYYVLKAVTVSSNARRFLTKDKEAEIMGTVNK